MTKQVRIDLDNVSPGHYVLIQRAGTGSYRYAVHSLSRKLFSTGCKAADIAAAASHAETELRMWLDAKAAVQAVVETPPPICVDEQPTLTDEERALIDDSDVIGAIKLIRARLALGLRDAKDLVDRYRKARLSTSFKPKRTLDVSRLTDEQIDAVFAGVAQGVINISEGLTTIDENSPIHRAMGAVCSLRSLGRLVTVPAAPEEPTAWCSRSCGPGAITETHVAVTVPGAGELRIRISGHDEHAALDEMIRRLLVAVADIRAAREELTDAH